MSVVEVDRVGGGLGCTVGQVGFGDRVVVGISIVGVCGRSLGFHYDFPLPFSKGLD